MLEARYIPEQRTSKDMTGASRDIIGMKEDSATPVSSSRRMNGRLDTWKEIGNFLGRDERTAKRWEAGRGLPVHRAPGGGRSMVYAYTEELTAWLRGAGAEMLGSEPLRYEPLGSEPDPAVPPVSEAFSAPAGEATAGRLDLGPQPAGGGRTRFLTLRWWGPTVAAGVLTLALLVLGSAFVGHRALFTTRASPNPEAVQLYQAGLHDWNTRTPDGLHMAVDEFTQAIVRDPNYAQAYAGLADCYNLLREYTGMPPSEAYPRAKAAALRAIALDDSLAGGHLALAFEQFYWEWNASKAEREFRRALQLDPQSAMAHHWHANFNLHLGDLQGALVEIDRAQQLDPSSTSILADKGNIMYEAGSSQDALALLQRIEQTSPDQLAPHRYLCEIYFVQGDFVDYLAETRKVADLMQDSSRSAVAIAALQGWRQGGEHAMLVAMLKAELELRSRGLISDYEVARTYARMGDRVDALRYLAASRKVREAPFIGIKLDLALKSLHALPAFKDLSRSFA